MLPGEGGDGLGGGVDVGGLGVVVELDAVDAWRRIRGDARRL